MRKINILRTLGFALVLLWSSLAISNVFANDDLVWIQNSTNGHYYAETEFMSSWADAEGLAQSFGGHIVTVNSLSEHQWLIETFKIETSETDYWIGLNDIAQEGNWVWSSGETTTFDNWCPGEPNDCCTEEDGEENAAVISSTLWPLLVGCWNDNLHLHHHYAIIEVTPAIKATVDIHPDTLNLKSKGNYVTCYIELPEGYNVEDIMVDTVKLQINGESVAADLSPIDINDYNSNGIFDLMVKFDRETVYCIVNAGAVEVSVVGDLIDGTSFEGRDTVLIIDKGQNHYSEDQTSVLY